MIAMKDAADFIAAGGTAERLLALADAAPVWTPTESTAETPARGKQKKRQSQNEPVENNAGNTDALNDTVNAELFVELYGDQILHWGERGEWLIWDGKRWNLDEENAVLAMGIAAAKTWWDRVPDCDGRDRDALIDHARASGDARKIKAAMELAQAMRAVSAAKLDRDPFLLNLLNGTLDLRTAKLREHRQDDRIAKLAPVEFRGLDAEAPRWDLFITEITDGNESLAKYLQRIFGLCLSGDISVQELYIFHGSGANGKSVFCDTMLAMLGDYAGSAANSLLTTGRNEHPTELADLCGKRAIVASENEESACLKVQLVKQLTGNLTIKARFMHQNYFEFGRTHKLILVTNNKPVVREATNAVWRRLRLVPFNVTIAPEKRDPHLLAKLKSEWSGILAWAVKGFIDCQANGMQTPSEVMIATESYRQDQDILSDYLSDRCVRASHAKVSRAELLNDYLAYCVQQADKHPLDRAAFYSRILAVAGVAEGQWKPVGLTVPVRGFKGIGLLSVADGSSLKT
jgi:putative DNA primase/helicase